jgi:hypothetical protein
VQSVPQRWRAQDQKPGVRRFGIRSCVPFHVNSSPAGISINAAGVAIPARPSSSAPSTAARSVAQTARQPRNMAGWLSSDLTELTRSMPSLHQILSEPASIRAQLRLTL